MHSKTSSRMEIDVLYFQWVQNTSVCLFLFSFTCEHLFTFLNQGDHSLLCVTSIRAGLRDQGEGSRYFRYSAEANLTKTHMHVKVNSPQSWLRHA